jgi:hypothetical protein
VREEEMSSGRPVRDILKDVWDISSIKYQNTDQRERERETETETEEIRNK